MIFKLRHSCLTTSSTVSVGSIRARTVIPSLVVTLFVGTNATDLGRWPLVEGAKPARPTVELFIGIQVDVLLISVIKVSV